MERSVDERAEISGTRLVLWGLAVIGALVAVSIAVSLLISVVTTIVTLVATALVLGGIGYLLASWTLGGDGSSREYPRSRSRAGAGVGDRADTGGRRGTSTDERGSLLDRVPGLGGEDRGDDRPEDPAERLTERYVNGEIDEAEYERRLEQHLGGPDEASPDDARRSRTREYER